jgi:hypothetical protein
MKSIESSLDWGGNLTVAVGDVERVDRNIVCLSEAANDGSRFTIADIAAGPFAATYYGNGPCPLTPTVANIASDLSPAATWHTDY